MKNFVFVLLFIALTALCWGVYGPVLRVGQAGMAPGSAHPPHLKPFICVGVAYFVIAILVPGLLLQLRGEKGRWTARGLFWSLLSGAAGAVGALGIILAFANHGSPILVMPLVFGCAPVVNTFYTMLTSKGHQKPGPLFFAGLIVVAAGAVTVLVCKPAPAKAVAAAQAGADAKAIPAKNDQTAANGGKEKPAAKAKAAASHDTTSSTMADMTMVLAFVALTALSWGVYGPVLHKGQMLMEGSRLRPLICVGVSYFVIAVLVPVALLKLNLIDEPGEFTFDGCVWSLAGGAVGALGALGIIMAFNFGGKPIYVMPLVFGCAPVINTFVSLSRQQVAEVSPLFYSGLIMVAAGAVTVLVFAPKAGHGPAPKKEPPKPKIVEQPA
jgi:drug/metabolite transporter (DMT)-like permease